MTVKGRALYLKPSGTCKGSCLTVWPGDVQLDVMLFCRYGQPDDTAPQVGYSHMGILPLTADERTWRQIDVLEDAAQALRKTLPDAG